jgi:hypothetical protein
VGSASCSTKLLTLRVGGVRVGFRTWREEPDRGVTRNPQQVRERPANEVERLLDDTLDPSTFTKAPVKKGTGTRWFDKNGNSFTVERQPQVGGSLHSGWYLKVAYRGQIVRIPLTGNPALGGS